MTTDEKVKAIIDEMAWFVEFERINSFTDELRPYNPLVDQWIEQLEKDDCPGVLECIFLTEYNHRFLNENRRSLEDIKMYYLGRWTYIINTMCQVIDIKPKEFAIVLRTIYGRNDATI